MKFHLISLFLFYMSISGFAQNSLNSDADFFKAQGEEYQKWLESTVIGDYLSVYKVVTRDTTVSIYLKFNDSSDADTVYAVWNTLRKDYNLANTISLEEKLFFKGTFIMQLGHDYLNIELFNTYDLDYEPYFTRDIYFHEGSVKINEVDPATVSRAITEKVEMNLNDINFKCPVANGVVNGKFVKQEVFDKISTFADNYFRHSSKVIEGRTPIVRSYPTLNHLQFEVDNLTGEVIKDASNSIWCPLLKRLRGGDCNWYPRELLIFTISFEQIAEETYELTVTVDGRVGNGVFSNVKRGSYINMEVEYERFLRDYARQITDDFRKCLFE